MEIYLELNQKFGHGFQVHIVHGPLNKTYDEEALDMYTAGAYAGTLLEAVNKEMGTSYEPHQAIRVTKEALEDNAKTDFAAARTLQDIRSEKYELSTPGEWDCKTAVIDGKKEMVFSGRGTVLITYFSWRDDKMPKAREALERYCQYIAAHGYKGGASKALAELDRLGTDAAVEWIRKTYARHVHDDEALIAYVMEQ